MRGCYLEMIVGKTNRTLDRRLGGDQERKEIPHEILFHGGKKGRTASIRSFRGKSRSEGKGCQSLLKKEGRLRREKNTRERVTGGGETKRS